MRTKEQIKADLDEVGAKIERFERTISNAIDRKVAAEKKEIALMRELEELRQGGK